MRSPDSINNKAANEAARHDLFPWPDFLAAHGLSDAYRGEAIQWFMPTLERLIALKQQRPGPMVVGINGSQGSGKSTLADFLCIGLSALAGLRSISMSLDDFYLTRAERESLGDSLHPLLATRGVPGTHDLALLEKTLAALVEKSGNVTVPRFNKASDDRTDSDQWHHVGAPVDVVIWEGWCLGVPPEPEARLAQPINKLESAEDSDCSWRRYVNSALEAYQPLFARVDYWVMLAAPKFDCVWRWRCEQEAKLRATLADAESTKVMTPEALERFVQFYQRLTEWGLISVPETSHFLYALDRNRAVTDLYYPNVSFQT